MKKMMFVPLLAGMLLLVMGCQDSGTMIRFATWDTEDALTVQRSIVEKFEAANPDIKVELEAYGDGFDQKLAAGFGAKNAPDIMYMWNFPVYKDSLEPLNSYIDGDASFSAVEKDLYEGLLSYSTIEGSIYGMPSGFTSHVVYYNKELFDQAGLPYPQEGWTWQELREMAKVLSALDDDIYGYGIPVDLDTYDYEQFFWTNGGSYLAPDGSSAEGYLNGKGLVEVMDFFAAMVTEGSAIASQTSVNQLFRGGNVAIQENGIWPLSNHLEALGRDKLGIVGLPGFGPDKPPVSVINISGLSMARHSENKEAAWKFIKYYTTEKEAVKARAEVDLPVLKSVAKEIGYLDDPFYGPYFTMLETAKDSSWMPSFLLHPKWSKINEHVYQAMESVLLEAAQGPEADPWPPQYHFDNAVKDSQEYFQ